MITHQSLVFVLWNYRLCHFHLLKTLALEEAIVFVYYTFEDFLLLATKQNLQVRFIWIFHLEVEDRERKKKEERVWWKVEGEEELKGMMEWWWRWRETQSRGWGGQPIFMTVLSMLSQSLVALIVYTSSFI